MIQYGDTSSIPQAIRDIVANKCQLLDQYILFQTGQYEYTALVRNPVTKETKAYVFSRSGNYSGYTMAVRDAEWDYAVTNEYYCYSNVGFGAALDLPAVSGVSAHAGAVLVCVVMLAVLFKGVLFPCLRKR